MEMSAPIALLVFIIVSIAFNDAARILAFFPVPSISHKVVFRPLTEELARRGHEVTVITTDPSFPKGEAPANLTEIDVHDFSYENWRTLYKYTSTEDNDPFLQVRMMFHMISKLVQMQMNVHAVQKVIKEEKIDFLLLEACVRPTLLLSHAIQVPVILVFSLGPVNSNVKTIGAAWHPLLYPDAFNQRLYNLSKSEKSIELWKFYQFQSIQQEVEDAENVIAKRMFGSNAPTINELKNNVDMLFLNTYPAWADNRPVPPSVIYLGGLHQKQEKELPKGLKKYLDSSKNGVIYISFGTNVQTSLLPRERVEVMAKVFSQLPYDVLWKWDTDDLPGPSENIRISKWLPQSDLLRHPKIKVFITQCGLQSTDEAITAGVPLIGVPMLGDQWYNAEKYVYHKIGAKLDFPTMTEDDFRNAIKTVIGDESYRRNIVKLGRKMYDQPQPPLERAVWWTEYVLRHGGARHLRAPAANMSWAQYLELEIVFTLLTVVLCLILLSSFVLYKLWKCFSGSLEHKKTKAN